MISPPSTTNVVAVRKRPAGLAATSARAANRILTLVASMAFPVSSRFKHTQNDRGIGDVSRIDKGSDRRRGDGVTRACYRAR